MQDTARITLETKQSALQKSGKDGVYFRYFARNNAKLPMALLPPSLSKEEAYVISYRCG